MKKMLLVWIAAAAGLLPSLSLTVNHSRNLEHALATVSRLSGDSALLSRVPATALLAVSACDLDERWGQIRNTRALADFQDALLSSHGLAPDLIPEIVGHRSAFFLAPADEWPFAVPVGLLQPPDPAKAQVILGKLPDLACIRDGSLLWIAPANGKELLARLATDPGPKFPDVVPLDEVADRLPAGGLIRGCLNAPAMLKLLRESAIDACPFPFRNAAAALAADLSAVRYVAFRRDFVDGQFTTDGLVAYDPKRLPPEVSHLLNPAASPVFIPASALAGSVGSPFVVAAFRPESNAWMPWIRYVAASDSRGPLRNLAFWFEEFQDRYARNLDRDLFSVIGDEGWLLIGRGGEKQSVEAVLVLELRGRKAIEGVVEDLFSWAGEQLWLDSFGILSTKPWRGDQPGTSVRGLTLRTPLTSVKGPAFEVVGRYLVISLQPSDLQTGRAWIDSVEAAKRAHEPEATGSHGTILLQPAEIGQLLKAVHPTVSPDKDRRLWDALMALMADAGTLRVDLKYEHDGVRFHGELPINQSEP